MVVKSDTLLEGKTIVISGGTKGLGRDLAVACAQQGATVVIGGRDVPAAENILYRIKSEGGKGLFIEVDLANPDNCRLFVEEAINQCGSIDGFVNYAGITSQASILDADIFTFDKIMDVNFRAAFFCLKYVVQNMISNDGGSIILVNSCHASRGEKDRAVYACSKGALATLSDHIAYHYAGDGVRCNTLTMGWSATEGEVSLRKELGVSLKELRETAGKVIPMGRMQESSDYIPGILYLLSDCSMMATGGNLRISGGLYL